MILFQQGLPGSGKSYEAVAVQIARALQAKRPVDAYIEGIDGAKIAAVLELPPEEVAQLLRPVLREDVPRIHEVARDNALVVIDEAQNFWPTGRQKLDPAMTQFITEHRHRGIDILLMGQVFTDVHKLWRGRISQLNTYHKLDAVGQENRYSVKVQKATSPERFVDVSSSFASYDPKWFGTYKSHVDDTISTANFADPRANVRTAWWLRWGVPLAIGGCAWGLVTVWQFLHPKPAAKPAAPAVAPAVPLTAASAPVVAAAKPASAPAARPKRKDDDFIGYLNDSYRPRLALLYQRQGAYIGLVEWYDGDKLRERLTLVQLASMGARLEYPGPNLLRVSGAWATTWEPPTKAAGMPVVGAQVVPLSAIAGQ